MEHLEAYRARVIFRLQGLTLLDRNKVGFAADVLYPSSSPFSGLPGVLQSYLSPLYPGSRILKRRRVRVRACELVTYCKKMEDHVWVST